MAFGPPRRDVPLRQGDPVGSLVQTLISQKERRDAKARRDRMEARQGEIDRMGVEDRARKQQMEDFEVQQKLEILKSIPALIKSEAEATSMATGAEPAPVTAKAIMEEGPDGKKKTQFEGTQEEVLNQMKSKFSGEPMMAPMDAPADAMLAPQAPLPTTPEGTPEMIPLTPTQAPPTSIPQERATASLDLFGIEEPVPLQTRKEFLANLEATESLKSNVLASKNNQRFRKTPREELWMYEQKLKMKKLYDDNPVAASKPQGSINTGFWRYNSEKDEIEIMSEPRAKPANDEKGRPPPGVIKEMRDIDFLQQKTMNLAALPSSYQQEIASWAPNIIRNFMSERHENEDDSFFEKYQKYDPAYFLFAAEMLKATQGGRPSDKDLEFYLEKMPKSNDRPEDKAEKIHWLLSQLKDKANSTKTVYGYYYDMSPFGDMTVPPKKDILALSGTHNAGGVQGSVPTGKEIGEVLENEHGTFIWDGTGWTK